MEWLNKLDDVLERGLKRTKKTAETPSEEGLAESQNHQRIVEDSTDDEEEEVDHVATPVTPRIIRTPQRYAQSLPATIQTSNEKKPSTDSSNFASQQQQQQQDRTTVVSSDYCTDGRNTRQSLKLQTEIPQFGEPKIYNTPGKALRRQTRSNHQSRKQSLLDNDIYQQNNNTIPTDHHESTLLIQTPGRAVRKRHTLAARSDSFDSTVESKGEPNFESVLPESERTKSSSINDDNASLQDEPRNGTTTNPNTNESHQPTPPLPDVSNNSSNGVANAPTFVDAIPEESSEIRSESTPRETTEQVTMLNSGTLVNTNENQSDDSVLDGDSDVANDGNSVESENELDQSAIEPRLPLDQIEYRSEFDVDRFESTWWEEYTNATQEYQPSMNCYGAVRVRVLRAQRLPCSVGSGVQAVISLKPWHGKVRSKKERSFTGTMTHHGVCVQWDEDETEPFTVVHAYSGEETPIPSIRVELNFLSLVGMLEFTMCSVEVSCEPLLKTPTTPIRQWFVAELHGSEQQHEIFIDQRPMIELEAMFEPVRGESTRGSSVNLPETIEISKNGDSTSSFRMESLAARKSPSKDYRYDGDERSLGVTSFSMHSVQRALTSKRHLLRQKVYFTPATCCVCHKNLMSGFRRRQVFRCEECKVDCCADCRLQVDAQLPCGSEVAKQAVEQSIQRKFTPENILNTVAPVSIDDEASQKLDSSLVVSHSSGSHPAMPSSAPGSREVKEEEGKGIGVLKVEFINAAVFEENLPVATLLEEVLKIEGKKYRKGDYYLKLSLQGTTTTVRTPTVQSSGRPSFVACGEIKIAVPHYGAAFTIELIDATTDRVLGITVLTAQGVLQRQRDSWVKEHGPFSVELFRGLPRLPRKLQLKTDFRSGLNTAKYYSTKSVTGQNAGQVSGWLESMVVLEEDVASLYGRDGFKCPSRPRDELDMSIIQNHIARISYIATDIKSVVENYHYMVSWKNPFLTGVSFVAFIYLCRRFDPVYFFHVPVLSIVLYMTFRGLMRRSTSVQDIFIKREVGMMRSTEKVNVEYALHRPVGLIKLDVKQARHIRSPELGLIGSAGIRIYWDPTRLLSDDEDKAKLSKVDKSASCSHDIASSDFLRSSSPAWNRLYESEVTRRLKLLLPNHDSLFTQNMKKNDHYIEFPVLQPYDRNEDSVFKLLPWSFSTGAIVVEVKFNDVLNFIPNSEYSLGEVVVPISILSERKKISGWFELQDSGSVKDFNFRDAGNELDSTSPQIKLEIAWCSPEEVSGKSEEVNREASIVIQEELIRSAIVSLQRKPGILGSSIGALHTVRGLTSNILFVQNMLGSILDAIEITKNLLNFTDPHKSSLILGIATVLWLVLFSFPSRFLIFAAGTGQYIATFVSRYGLLSKKSPKGKKIVLFGKSSEEPKLKTTAAPHITWVRNGLQSVPTDEDLRKAFFWEGRRIGSLEVARHSDARRSSRLQKLWRAQWYSPMYILKAVERTEEYSLEPIFAVIQGHRFLWWESPHAFDNGETIQGSLFLEGHAGLTNPSPLEQKLFNDNDIPRLSSIFGKGMDTQERITLLAPSVETKNHFESAVLFATTEKKD